MKKYRVYMETPYAGQHPTEDFEMPDDATQEEIDEEAKEIFFNNFSYGVEELTEEENTDDGWYCEHSPTHKCDYLHFLDGYNEDCCIYCGEPYERK